MTYVDSAVLNATERLCRRFQALTGRTNVWLAFQLTNLSIVVYFVWVGSLYVLSGSLVLRVFVALFSGGVFFMLTKTVFRDSIEASEAEAYRRVAKGLRNPRRLRDAQLRIAFLTLTMVLSYPLVFASNALHLRFILLADALIILTTAVLYVLACDPLPPCPGRVNDWLRSLRPAVGVESAPQRTGVDHASTFGAADRDWCVRGVRHDTGRTIGIDELGRQVPRAAAGVEHARVHGTLERASAPRRFTVRQGQR